MQQAVVMSDTGTSGMTYPNSTQLQLIQVRQLQLHQLIAESCTTQTKCNSCKVLEWCTRMSMHCT